MKLIPFLRPIRSAPVARKGIAELARIRSSPDRSADLIPVLHAEILAAISRHITVDPDKVQVRIDRSAAVWTLGLEIEIPSTRASAAVGA
jgi:cell division topological specificity factor